MAQGRQIVREVLLCVYCFQDTARANDVKQSHHTTSMILGLIDIDKPYLRE